jgi:hypothetical protein
LGRVASRWCADAGDDLRELNLRCRQKANDREEWAFIVLKIIRRSERNNIKMEG